LAGTQGGKTSFGPHWLYREIQRCGPGDYIVVAPTYPMLNLKLVPEFKRLFERWLRLGKMSAGATMRFEFSPDGQRKTFGHYNPDVPTTVIFGHAMQPESLESATCKAAWLDEAGQKRFKLGSWDAILRRLSLATRHGQGRVLITTTPYDLGWLKQQVWDKWKQQDPTATKKVYDVIRFDSTENPSFPPEEFEDARRRMPKWKFDMFYRAIFTRPAGMIYDSYIDELAPNGHLVPRFTIPDHWPRYAGIDFGGVNTAACLYARETIIEQAEKPSMRGWVVQRPAGRPRSLDMGRYFLYRTYKAGSRAIEVHAKAIKHGEPMVPTAVGGSKSEGQWRIQFASAGLPVASPVINEVEVGIGLVYGMHAENRIMVFDDLQEYREEKTTYSREVDDQGEPTEKIEDKSTYHHMDAERYIMGFLAGYDSTPQVI